jgi:mono/diheme cytochrome c family protein
MKLLPAVVAVWGAALVVAAAQSSAPAPGPRPASGNAPAAQAPAPRPVAPTAVRASAPLPAAEPALVKQYCATCHNERTKAGGLVLEPEGVNHVDTNPEVWETVVRKIKTGMMPPSGMPRPSRAVLDGFAAGLEAQLDRANPPGAHPDAPALHRLNRTEYANAIRDLLALDVDVKPLLPSDDSNEGFDNIAEALTVSPALVQGYVAAAMKISRQAIGDPAAAPVQITYSAPGQQRHDKHIEGLPLGTRGGLLVKHHFPLDAEYEFTIGGGGGGGFFAGGGAAGATSLDFTIDGEPVTVRNPRGFRHKVPAGPHTIGIAIVDRQRGAGVDEGFSDFRVDSAFTPGGGINAVTILGPFNPTGTGETPSQKQVFICRPATPGQETPPASAKATARSRRSSQEVRASEDGCARRIVSAMARRAFRQPPTASDVDTLMAFYREGYAENGFHTGIQHALARILVAPKFVFRTEAEMATAGRTYAISDLALASRLSFFLWSSIPDEELLSLAERGRLSNKNVLAQQVARMLKDRKSDALVRNFSGQWLYLRELGNVQSDARSFDDNLRQSFRRETELLFDSIVREDRPLTTLIDADYTFVDERLARHYGIPNVYGSYFRKVTLAPDSARRGLLGHGSILTVTSIANRTSPVMRGKWVLENLLGTPPPEPPPGVEVNLDEDPKAAKPTTLRQRLEMHRANPVCASCHKIMDPMGFALENFDLVGAWREKDGLFPIDSTGQLADGTPLNGAADLRKAVLDRSDAFMTVATEKLLIYALGRPLHATDMSTVREVARTAARNDQRFSALVLGVVESPLFRLRTKKS